MTNWQRNCKHWTNPLPKLITTPHADCVALKKPKTSKTCSKVEVHTDKNRTSRVTHLEIPRDPKQFKDWMQVLDVPTEILDLLQAQNCVNLDKPTGRPLQFTFLGSMATVFKAGRFYKGLMRVMDWTKTFNC